MRRINKTKATREPDYSREQPLPGCEEDGRSKQSHEDPANGLPGEDRNPKVFNADVAKMHGRKSLGAQRQENLGLSRFFRALCVERISSLDIHAIANDGRLRQSGA